MKLVVDNAWAYNLVVIDSTGKNVTYPSLNSNYTIDGTESYVNSGWIWSKGQASLGAPPITALTITFEKLGIYDYICIAHPWMTRSVVVVVK